MPNYPVQFFLRLHAFLSTVACLAQWPKCRKVKVVSLKVLLVRNQLYFFRIFLRDTAFSDTNDKKLTLDTSQMNFTKLFEDEGTPTTTVLDLEFQIKIHKKNCIFMETPQYFIV